MAENPWEEVSSSKIVVTLKGGKGYDAPWIVIHGNTVDEVHEHFDNKRFIELMARARDASNYFANPDLTAKKPKKAKASAESTKPGMPEGASENPNGKPKFNAETGKVDFFN